MSEFDKEMAKAGGQVVIDTAKDARRALSALFGDATREMATMLGDTVRLWRVKNLIRIADEVSRIAEARQISREQLKALPLGDALRVADAAANEDDPELQSLWARLIANATIDPERVKIERAFIDLLKGMSPAEAAFLDLLWSLRGQAWLGSSENASQKRREIGAKADGGWRRFAAETQAVAVQNLLRMRCIAIAPPRKPFISDFQARSMILSTSGTSRREPSADPDKIRRSYGDLVDYVAVSSGGQLPRGPIAGATGSEHFPEAMYRLTPLGSALMQSCAQGEQKAPSAEAGQSEAPPAAT